MREEIAKLIHKSKVVLRWILANCGIPGNEIADKLAKEGASLEQDDRKTTYQEAKTIIKRNSKKNWLDSHRDYNKKDPYHHLSREDQVIIFRLRTGHNKLHFHRKRLNLCPSDACLCGHTPITAKHNYSIRKIHWHQDNPFQQKILGDLLDLRKTADFIRETKIAI